MPKPNYLPHSFYGLRDRDRSRLPDFDAVTQSDRSARTPLSPWLEHRIVNSAFPGRLIYFFATEHGAAALKSVESCPVRDRDERFKLAERAAVEWVEIVSSLRNTLS